MRGSNLDKILFAVVLTIFSSGAAVAQPLSYWLGAAKLDGLSNYTACQNQARGFRETLMADRLAKKLAISTALSADERKVWQDDIAALHAVVDKHIAYKAPDASKPQQYLEGFTQDEFRAIQGMTTRYTQEINLSCEQKYGDIARKKDGETTDSQAKLEARMRKNMVEPVDVGTLTLAALPSPFPKPEASPEQQLAATKAQARAGQASSQAALTRISGCTAQMTGLRLTLMADKMQAKLAGGASLNAQQRKDMEADIAALRAAGAQGLGAPPPVDPASPYRFMTWLSNEENAEIAAQYGTQAAALMTKCTQN
jgi:hypothetical protein